MTINRFTVIIEIILRVTVTQATHCPVLVDTISKLLPAHTTYKAVPLITHCIQFCICILLTYWNDFPLSFKVSKQLYWYYLRTCVPAQLKNKNLFFINCNLASELLIIFPFYSVKDWTQGLAHARQAITELEAQPSLSTNRCLLIFRYNKCSHGHCCIYKILSEENEYPEYCQSAL
jgi:hypothetical protein